MQVKSLILVGTLEKMCVFDPYYSNSTLWVALSGRTNLFLGSLKCFTKARFESRFDFFSAKTKIASGS
ncbi:hypothetical protein B9T54_13230 [Leptospira borgpetersenii serovar Hardjo-bovis]|nr:hypothetical protein B9T54_13230 [Leptospira borgpetersenii serovar Hardjo-bovis]